MFPRYAQRFLIETAYLRSLIRSAATIAKYFTEQPHTNLKQVQQPICDIHTRQDRKGLSMTERRQKTS